MSTDNRPMSPHLDIYRWRITMLTSILHRASGAFISLGLFILVVKLTLISIHGEAGYVPSGFLMKSFWFVWTTVVYYHLCNGVRHLVWDAGHGFDVRVAERSAKIVMIATVVLSVVTWFFV